VHPPSGAKNLYAVVALPAVGGAAVIKTNTQSLGSAAAALSFSTIAGPRMVHSAFHSGSGPASFFGILQVSADCFGKSFQGKNNLFRNLTESGIPARIVPKGRTRDLCHNTILLFCNLPYHSMLPVVPGPKATVLCLRHPQPVDAETEHRGRIRFIEFRVLMYTQLAVTNSQRL